MTKELFRKINLFFVSVLLCGISVNAQNISTLAGSAQGYLDATGTAAQFFYPASLCYDGLGNMYVADRFNNRIRKVEIATGNVTTVAGSTAGNLDGTGPSALFSVPYGICTDGTGNLYVTDQSNHRIRKIEIATGVVTTLAGSNHTYSSTHADGIGTAAIFNAPAGICSDGLGNLYVADGGNNRIRKIEIATANVTTFAGSSRGFIDGIGQRTRFNLPNDICYDGVGNLYVADRNNSSIRKIEIATATVTTLAGDINRGYVDGTGTTARFYEAGFICYDGMGNLYVADFGNFKIRKIEIATATVTTLAGTTVGYLDGPANTAKFSSLSGIGMDTSGNLYVADVNKIRKVSDISLSVSPTEIPEIKIHPNPTSNILVIKNPFSGNLHLNVVNQLGQLVLKQNQDASLKSLDVSKLSKGLYFLNVDSEDGRTQTIKFIKN